MSKIRYVTNLPDNKDQPFGGAFSVYDEETVQVRNDAVIEFIEKSKSLNHDDVRKTFLNTYKDWAFSTHPKIDGVKDYDKLCFTNGTTESFAQFYLRYRENKRLRLAKGEYFYSQMMKALYYQDNFAWLDDDEIQENDFVLISVPFSDHGDVPKFLENLLSDCDNKKVPVMLDLAYLNLAKDFEIDLTHPCIEYVVTSLSKVFPVEHHRIGIRMQRNMYEDQLYVVNEDNYNYINLLGAYIGTKLMRCFTADFIFNKYRSKQIAMCQKYNLKVSPCVYFGIDHQNQYPIYNRGCDTNRLCFTKIWDGRAKESDVTLQ